MTVFFFSDFFRKKFICNSFFFYIIELCCLKKTFDVASKYYKYFNIKFNLFVHSCWLFLFYCVAIHILEQLGITLLLCSNQKSFNPLKTIMVDGKSFQELNKTLLYIVDKIIRYRHHVAFISTYLKLKSVPKGFKLKFHSNIPDVKMTSVLRNCSFKLMVKIQGYYKTKLKDLEKSYSKIATDIVRSYPDRSLYVRNIFRNKLEKLSPDLERRRIRKFHRDSIPFTKALEHSKNVLNSFKTLSFSRQTPKESEMHHPIVLTQDETTIDESFKKLCSKGPTFVPTPEYYDWLQLQKDFDAFRNRVRACYIFHGKENKQTPELNIPIVKDPPKKSSTWVAPKTSSPELETFLNNIESDLFIDTSRKKVFNNLQKGERDALKDWRKNHLFNQDSDLILRLQDKGNRFVIVDKETDQTKAKEQIARSSFTELDHDPTESHIQKVVDWAEKWHSNGQINKQWKEFIINRDSKPGKNSTLYKTHKAGTPVRLLTSGCNTAIENLSKYIEVVCAPLTENLPSRIKNTSHLLDIVDKINSDGLPEGALLVSFDIVNMFPSIDNQTGIRIVREALDKRPVKVPSTECIIEGLEICLYNNNSTFANLNLLQTNGTATGAPNSCSYADLAVTPIDNAVFDAMKTTFTEMRYFGRYRDDCFTIWVGTVERLNSFLTFLNSQSDELKFTMEIGDQELCFLDVKISIVGNKLEINQLRWKVSPKC